MLFNKNFKKQQWKRHRCLLILLLVKLQYPKSLFEHLKKKLKVMGEGFMVHLRVKPPLLVATLITCVFPYLSCATSYGHKYPCFLKLCIKSNTKPNFNPF